MNHKFVTEIEMELTVWKNKPKDLPAGGNKFGVVELLCEGQLLTGNFKALSGSKLRRITQGTPTTYRQRRMIRFQWCQFKIWLMR